MDFSTKLQLIDVIKIYGQSTITVVEENGNSFDETFDNINELEAQADFYEIENTVYYEVR